MNTSILKPERRRGQMVENTCAILRQAILDGELNAESGFIQEKPLYTEMGISKGTLRKSMVILQSEGLLRSIPYKGYILGPTAHQLKARKNEHATQILFIQEPGLTHAHITRREESVLRAAKAEAEQQGLELQLCCLAQEDLLQEGERLIAAGELAGVGMEYPHREFSELLLANGIPGVMVECGNDQVQFDTLFQDDRGGIEKAVSYLWNKGHRTIGFIGWAKHYIQPQQRRAAFIESLLRRGEMEPPLMGTSLRFDAQGGAEATRSVFSEKRQATALVISHMEMAAGVCNELDRMGKAPGKDIELVSWGTESQKEAFFKNTDWADCFLPMISWSRESMGQMMVRMLQARIQTPDIPHMKVEIETELTIPRNETT